MSICPIEKLIQFDLLDDCIHTPAGYYHFYRYYPPNTDIMTEEEKKAEIEQMTQLFDTLAREIAIFATDKIEDMSEIKRFYKNLAPEYDHLTSDIIAAIESTESRNSAAVQRAFYFIIRTDKQEESVYNQIAGKGYHINKAQREELAVLLRNYYLREFISAEIYTLEKELKQDVKLRKKIEKKPELFQKELQRRLLPHSMEFFPSFAVQNGTYRSTMMLKNFPFEIGSCCLLQTACMRGTSFMMRLMLRRLVDNDPNAGKLFEEYRTTQQEIVKTYAENPISVAKKMKEWENDFFHPAQGGDSKRHNMIISSAISFDREQEYREKCQAAITRSLIYNLCRSINQDNERGKKVLAHTSKTTKKIQPKRITARKAARMEPIRPE